MEPRKVQDFRTRPEFQQFLQIPYDRNTNPQAQALKSIIGQFFKVVNLRSMAKDLKHWSATRLERQATREEWSLVFYFQFHMRAIEDRWTNNDFTCQRACHVSSGSVQRAIVATIIGATEEGRSIVPDTVVAAPYVPAPVSET
jgi:hypothetical protein